MTCRLGFTKMSGAGNDFVVLDARSMSRRGDDLADWVRRVCRRGLSVGADGVILVEPTGDERVRVAFHNPDGSAAFCGNGTRCAARFAKLEGYAGAEMVLETSWGEIPAIVFEDRVRLRLPPPSDRGTMTIQVGDERLTGRWVHAGVPHFLLPCVDVARAPLERWGPVLRRAGEFGASGSNIDLVGRGRGEEVVLRTWERGVEGETLACGSAAVAAAYDAHLGGLGAVVRVLPKSGIPLEVELVGPRERPEAALLTGDARMIFRGTLDPEATEGFEAC